MQTAFDIAKTRFLAHKVLAGKQQWIGGSSDTNVDLQSKRPRFESSKGININRLPFFFSFFSFPDVKCDLANITTRKIGNTNIIHSKKYNVTEAL